MKIILSLALLTVPFGPLLADAQSDFQKVEDDRGIASFLETLMGEIQKQKQFVDSLQAQGSRRDIIPDNSIVARYQNAVEMLNVKKTLYSNFANTPSIRSPIVQKKLLSIFQKEMITAADLAELQAIVNQERPKYVEVPSTVVPVTPKPPQ